MRLFNRRGWLLFLPAIILICSTSAFAAQSITARLPLVFEPNRGQAPAEVQYILRGGTFAGEFQKDGVLFRLSGDKKIASQVRMRLVGAREDAVITGGGTLEGHTNYLMGNDPAHWLRGLPNYTKVRYSRIYPGTDLVFYGNGGSLEHDFEVQPGADPRQISFQLGGAESIALDKNGDLHVSLASGAIAFRRPIAYQTVAGVRRNVAAAFMVDHNGTIRFQLGSYDTSQKLVIDPVLSFSTYISPQASVANLIVTDASGNNYVVGYGAVGIPVTPGAFAGCTGCTTSSAVAFISKLSADGTNLIYSTVLGGAQPTGIAVDANGNVIVSGWTSASSFPTKNGQTIATSINATYGFLVSLSADGSSLNYGTMLGAAPSVSPVPTTYASAVAVDSSGNAYVTGETGDGFFISPGALNKTAVGWSRNMSDVFLAKFNPTGTLLYSAVLGTADPQNGGGGLTGASAIAVDTAGDAFVAGQAGTLWPISSNAYLKQIAGSTPYATPFVTKVSPDAKSMLYSTYLDYAYVVTGIAALPTGDVFVAGNYPAATYPTTANAYLQNTGHSGAFLTELNSDGSGLDYSTVVGDASYKINGLALDPDGDIWLAGQTSNSQFPLLHPIQTVFPPTNLFPALASTLDQFDPTGQTLKFSTFLGGSASGYASSVAVGTDHKVHVSGAEGYGMYTTPGVYAGSVPAPGSGYSGATYAYVALIDPATSSGTLCLANTQLSFNYLLPQTTASQNVHVTNCGDAPLLFTSIASNNAAFTVPVGSNSCIGSLAVGSSCDVSVKFAPTAVQAYSGQLTFTSNASIITTSIPLSGNGAEPLAEFGPQGYPQTTIFSSLLVGQTSPVRYVDVYNGGMVPLIIYPQQTAVTNGFVLAPGGNCSGSLAAHQYCTIVVQFAPQAPGTFSGTLSVSSSDPAHPTISAPLTGTAYTSYPIATITSLLNPSYPIGGTTPITMTVMGTNFFAASVVYINGVAQSTTYQSDTSLSVTFDPSVVNAVGAIPVTVVNPTPGGSSRASYPLIGYRSLPLTASALAVDPVGGLLYAAIPSTASQNPNTIIPINPATGAMMTPIAVASGPRALAVSDDGSELYVASTGVLQRINLKTLTIEKTFNLPVDTTYGQTYVQEMHVVPGSPQSIVVELFAVVSPAEDGAALYNDSGLVNWIPGLSLVNGGNSIFWLDSFTFTSSPSIIYGLPIDPTGGTFFAEIQVGPSGLSRTAGGVVSGQPPQQSGSIIRSDGALLYTNTGQVWDPTTQKLLGTYLGSDGSPLSSIASVIPETAKGHTYFLDGFAQYGQYESLGIDVYDQASDALVGAVPFLGLNSTDAVDLVRWGSNGFAFRSANITGSTQSENQIVIVTSDLVTSSGITPIPILASVSPAKVYAGGPTYTMQLTGSGFTRASTVLIYGSPRATTYVSGTSLTAQVLDSDIATIGQLNVQVTTPAPGGGTSNYAYASIDTPPQTAPTVTLAPSATTITTAQPLTVAVTVSGGSGKATPTGSVTLSGGGFTSVAVALSSGIATINIPAGSLGVGVDPLAVTYTPDSASSTIYNGATGAASIAVTTVVKSASTISATPASTTITNEQTDTVSITVAGVSGQPTPTGAVTLMSGSYSAQQTLANGAASFTVPAGALSSGANTLTATYSGDETYAGSSGTASITVSQVVIAAPTQPGVSPGGSTTTNVTLSASSTYSGTMNMSCALVGSPVGAQSLPTCSLNPTSVKVAAGGTGATVLTVQTKAASTAALIAPSRMNLFGFGGGTILAGLLLIGVPARRRRWMPMLALLLIIVVAGVVGCAGGGSSNAGSGGSGSGSNGSSIPATTAGTYAFTLTGVDSANSSITTSANAVVIVQ